MLADVSAAAGQEHHRAARLAPPAPPASPQLPHCAVTATAAAVPVTPGPQSQPQTDSTAPCATALCTFVSTASSDAVPAHLLSDIDATTTPLSTKLYRRTQIFSNEGREDDDHEYDDDVEEKNEVSPCQQQAAARSAADGAVECDKSPPTASTGTQPLQDDDDVRTEFRSVLQQLEQAGTEGQRELREHISAVDLPSTLAPSVTLETPRDAAPAANLHTPFVFSTVHLKSPGQVGSGMAVLR